MASSLVLGILASSVAASAPLAVAFLAVAPLYATTQGTRPIVLNGASRAIGNAFTSLPPLYGDPNLAEAATRALKGDLPRPAVCARKASCIPTVNGLTSPHVPTITIGYQDGANTTVITRIPFEELARR